MTLLKKKDSQGIANIEGSFSSKWQFCLLPIFANKKKKNGSLKTLCDTISY